MKPVRTCRFLEPEGWARERYHSPERGARKSGPYLCRFCRNCFNTGMRRFMALVLAFICVSACSRPQTSGNIKVGVFLSLTGATASYGTSSLNAIQLATDEANNAGGSDGKRIELVVEDDHSNTQDVPAIVT